MPGKMARSRLEGRAPGVVSVESTTGYPSKPRSTNSLTITAPRRAYIVASSGSFVSEIRSGERSRTGEIWRRRCCSGSILSTARDSLPPI